MKTELIKEIRKLRPELELAERFYLYRPPVRNVLCGFVYEEDKNSKGVWKFALPLYDKVQFLHLGFGVPIQHWGGEKLPVKDEARRFVEVIGPHEAETYSWSDPAVFLSHAEVEDALINPWNRRGVALTHIMLGNAARATAHLRVLLDGAEIDRLPDFRSDLTKVDEELQRGIVSAQALLSEWKQITKQRFALA